MTMRDLEGIERKIKTNTHWFEFLTYHNSFIRVGEEVSIQDFRDYIARRYPMPSVAAVRAMVRRKNREFGHTLTKVKGKVGVYVKVRRNAKKATDEIPEPPHSSFESEEAEREWEETPAVRPELPVVPVVPEEVELIETFSAVVVLEFLSREERSIVMGLISRYVVEREYTHEKTDR